MDNTVQNQIVQFNRLFKRYDDIYRRAAKNFDLPELALWILYVLRENNECTQKDIVDQLLQSKQSINSSIKMLEQDGYVKLEYSEKNRKNKYVHLTEKGATLSVSTANKIVEAENRAFKALDATELETLLKLFERLSTSLNNEMGKIK